MAGKGISGEDMDGRLFSLGAKEKPQPPGQGLRRSVDRWIGRAD
jgi:hypothetical protein